MACNEGWQVAGRRKGAARRGKQVLNPKLDSQQDSDCKIDQQKIIHGMNELRGETFWMEWKDLLCERLLSSTSEQSEDASLLQCVCYGLGHFESCVSARFQLAMLLLLLETLQEGKRAVYQPTLFYLMHCGKALYNNLLWRNWTPRTLQKMTIIGNSFNGIQERMLQRELERDYSFLSRMIGVCEETPLSCSSRFLDVFNDTALIQFPLENLNKLPECTWTEPSEPLYQHCQDLEIIQREKD
ncbi:SRR1-like protein isoform X4 [Danio rerio]|uniref:SRR1-like protein isoform X4 n=1 Tax=Danio rerio TaxID=7955 RepID=A0A8M6Z262_DANRE|nr:SRR1-like protein isoform X3 [Danio rerio]|eukprot:XP_017212863.1 SRR1-like protein isoform X3 [Danio rerio]